MASFKSRSIDFLNSFKFSNLSRYLSAKQFRERSLMLGHGFYAAGHGRLIDYAILDYSKYIKTTDSFISEVLSISLVSFHDGSDRLWSLVLIGSNFFYMFKCSSVNDYKKLRVMFDALTFNQLSGCEFVKTFYKYMTLYCDNGCLSSYGHDIKKVRCAWMPSYVKWYKNFMLRGGGA